MRGFRRLPCLSALMVAGLCAVLAACGDSRIGTRATPPLFQDLARYGQTVDLPTAASVFSAYRQNNSLSPITPDPRLVEVARETAILLASRDSVDASLDRSSIAERVAKKGVKTAGLGENVSAGYRTLAEAFSGWRGSRPHDQVLKLPGATHFGIAAVYSPRSKYGVFWAMVVAREE